MHGGRAARPVPPLCLQTRCLSILRLRKQGRAGGPPRAFAWRLRRFGLVSRDRPAEPTPSHSRALGRAPCFGLPTNAGDLAQVLNTRSPVGSLTLPGTRIGECSLVYGRGLKTKPRVSGV
jgi:hypothetical protein